MMDPAGANAPAERPQSEGFTFTRHVSKTDRVQKNATGTAMLVVAADGGPAARRQSILRLQSHERRQVVQRAADASDHNTQLVYTPVVSKKPINFTPDGYRLQSTTYMDRDGKPTRKIKMFIVVTMYAEDKAELSRTLRGICHNVASLQQQYNKRGGGGGGGGLDGTRPAWQEVCVCIVSDGRREANPGTLDYIGRTLNCYSASMMDEDLFDDDDPQSQKSHHTHKDAEPTTMHLFEVTRVIQDQVEGWTAEQPLQMMFALKELNGGKLDSHLWFFNAFADQLNPKYTFLLDVGTEPEKRALLLLYQCMEENATVAGVCGEITAQITKGSDYLNPVVAAQVFEYKVSHFLDKALESTYGFISVLPGAFSAYRWRAIREEKGKGPLVEYFKTVTCTPGELGPFKANMFLAEDRVLCFELIARKGCNWTLEYVKGAVAVTDVPQDLVTLIRQRRRWLNGSFFALLYAIINFGRYWEDSRHSVWRKLSILTQFFYFVVNVMLTWLLIGNYFLAFYFLVQSAAVKRWFGDWQPPVAAVLCALYLFLTLAQVVVGLSNKPAEMARLYTFSQHFYGMYSYLVLSLSYIFIFDQSCGEGAAPLPGAPPLPYIWGPGLQHTNASIQGDHGVIEQCEQQKAHFAQCDGRAVCRATAHGASGNYTATCCHGQIIVLGGHQLPPDALRWASVATVGAYFAAALLHNELHHILLTAVQYFYMLPTFVNIFNIYSFANMHDISWGTKGLEEEEKKNRSMLEKASRAGIGQCCHTGCAMARPAPRQERDHCVGHFNPATGAWDPGFVCGRHLKADLREKQRDLATAKKFAGMTVLRFPCGHGVCTVCRRMRYAAQEKANDKLNRRLNIAADRHSREVEDARELAQSDFRRFRSFMLITWIFTNFEFCYVIMTSIVDADVYLPFLFLAAALFIGLRLVGSVVFLVKRALWNYAWVPLRRTCCTSYYDDNANDPNRKFGPQHLKPLLEEDFTRIDMHAPRTSAGAGAGAGADADADDAPLLGRAADRQQPTMASAREQPRGSWGYSDDDDDAMNV
eukprot:g971.t1